MCKSCRLLFLGVLLVMVSLLLGTACRGRGQDSRQPEYKPTATIKDIMLSIVDPSADVVWGAVKTVFGSAGAEETVPRTDEDWTNARHAALRLAEATNLLQMPDRHVARPGEKSETPGVELEPTEMEALINKDKESWNKRAQALHDASLAALQAIDAKNAQTLFEVGEQIEMACENCHLQYWYPNERIPRVPTELRTTPK